ncbi:translation initiation factor IF-2-like [Elephas maximus indicus]|uniref:translation initiation factor IF-2-like n=1 Tax=Elephas maximus indicus TaxID=99487 RepID=UPI002116CDB1|nr:translation initiation factor IF-2-like [Elephas maximus indicus]
MVALEVGLPSLPLARSLARSLLPASPRAPSFSLHSSSSVPSCPARTSPARSHSQPGLSRSPSESGAGRPCGPDSAAGDRDGPPSPRGGRGAGGGSAAGRSPGRNQGWAGGGDAGVREPRSRSKRASVAGEPGRRSGAGASRAAHRVPCPGGARARGGRRGAARREDARELRDAGRRRGAAPAGGGGPGLRLERAPCRWRAGPGPGDAGGGWAGDQTNSLSRALSCPLTGSLCVCKLPAGDAPGAGRSRARAGALCSSLGRPRRTDPAQKRHPAPGPGPGGPELPWEQDPVVSRDADFESEALTAVDPSLSPAGATLRTHPYPTRTPLVEEKRVWEQRDPKWREPPCLSPCTGHLLPNRAWPISSLTLLLEFEAPGDPCWTCTQAPCLRARFTSESPAGVGVEGGQGERRQLPQPELTGV